MIICTKRTELEINGLRHFYINTPLTGGMFAHTLEWHRGYAWFDAWWTNDQRTDYVVSIGRWELVGELPDWVARLLGRSAVITAA